MVLSLLRPTIAKISVTAKTAITISHRGMLRWIHGSIIWIMKADEYRLRILLVINESQSTISKNLPKLPQLSKTTFNNPPMESFSYAAFQFSFTNAALPIKRPITAPKTVGTAIPKNVRKKVLVCPKFSGNRMYRLDFENKLDSKDSNDQTQNTDNDDSDLDGQTPVAHAAQNLAAKNSVTHRPTPHADHRDQTHKPDRKPSKEKPHQTQLT
ncbi:hypothetical protein OGAPHI_001255 [Ogataea philodendri]|uniref:Uncharacterized protein n=1 Tax=Ogataea philodendri TaxID=1378263 RepID=A0A9P8PFL5_9ASCO|nr:uncharacterized protein OGAPHI_001255 [Ogataea philodendri]KAH3670740.1 hypothetical protein OGAPHI_001255 [Ogataea philodendri]